MNLDQFKVITFLRPIGLKVDMLDGANGFINGVRIAGGGLLVDPQCRPSGLLQEAGH